MVDGTMPSNSKHAHNKARTTHTHTHKTQTKACIHRYIDTHTHTDAAADSLPWKALRYVSVSWMESPQVNDSSSPTRKQKQTFFFSCLSATREIRSECRVAGFTGEKGQRAEVFSEERALWGEGLSLPLPQVIPSILETLPGRSHGFQS